MQPQTTNSTRRCLKVGRKRGPAKVRISLYIEPWLYDEVVHKALQNNTTLSGINTLALLHYLTPTPTAQAA